MKSETIISGTGSVGINGHIVHLNGKKMKITEDGIYIDGVSVEQYTEPSKEIKIEITGNVQSIQTVSADITVHGNVSTATTMSGDIISHSVSGNFITMSGSIIHR